MIVGNRGEFENTRGISEIAPLDISTRLAPRALYGVEPFTRSLSTTYAIDPYWQMVYCGLVTSIESLKRTILSEAFLNWEAFHKIIVLIVSYTHICSKNVNIYL